MKIRALLCTIALVLSTFWLAPQASATGNHHDLECGEIITGTASHGQDHTRYYDCTGQTQWNGRADIFHLPHVGGPFWATLDWLNNPNTECDDLVLILVQECPDDNCDHDGEDDGDDDDDWGHDWDHDRNGDHDDDDERDFCCIATDAHFIDQTADLCGECGETCHHDGHGDGDDDGDHDDHGWNRDGWNNGCGHGDNDRHDGGHDDEDECPDYWLIVESRCNTNTAYTLQIFCCDYQLDVELASFTASKTSEGVTLNWSTASETSNDRFEISRLDHASDNVWEQVGVVEGQGTTGSAANYSFIDHPNGSGAYDYALRSVDMNGGQRVVGQVTVNSSTDPSTVVTEFELIGNYPNPFNPTTSVRFQLAEAGRINLSVFDVQGRLVTTLMDGVVAAGVHEQTFDAAGLASGVYFARLTSGSQSDLMKMVLMK